MTKHPPGCHCSLCDGELRRSLTLEHELDGWPNDARERPTPTEEQLAYEILRPAPWDTTPHRHVSRLLIGMREGIVQHVLEPLCERLSAESAAELRTAIATIRGERKETES